MYSIYLRYYVHVIMDIEEGDFINLNITNVLSHPEEIHGIGELLTVHLEGKFMGLLTTTVGHIKH